MIRPHLVSLYGASIVDTVREPLLLLTEDLHVVTANASFLRTFGNRHADIVGQYLYDIGGGEWDLPELRRLLEEILPADTELRDFEVESRRGAPDQRTLLLNAKRLQHDDRDVRLILLAFEDVTERRRLEQALRLAMAELERSNHELEGFASIASHDLQEPLRKIQAFGERLEAVTAGQLPEKGRDYLARMTAAAARMQTLIKNVLSLSRVTVKGGVWQPVDLGAIVADVLIDFEHALSSSGGRVEVGGLPVIDADPTQMQQLFHNLISNALKFRGVAAPHVRIAASQCGSGEPQSALCAAGRPAWQIVVSDNGIGFEPKYAERVFKPFERLHGRGVYEGTGIGLALCRRIVLHHGGTITADAVPGGGARFIVHFPSRENPHA
jgi:PAS domain S-box-containing protein